MKKYGQGPVLTQELPVESFRDVARHVARGGDGNTVWLKVTARVERYTVAPCEIEEL